MPAPPDTRDESSARTRFILLGILLAALGGVAALCKLVAAAIEKVRAGEGLETYRTMWLVEFSVGVLVFFAVLVLALVIAGGVWWREERQLAGPREEVRRESKRLGAAVNGIVSPDMLHHAHGSNHLGRS